MMERGNHIVPTSRSQREMEAQERAREVQEARQEAFKQAQEKVRERKFKQGKTVPESTRRRLSGPRRDSVSDTEDAISQAKAELDQDVEQTRSGPQQGRVVAIEDGMERRVLETRSFIPGRPREGALASEVTRSGGSIRFSAGGGQAPTATKVTVGERESRAVETEEDVEVMPTSISGITALETDRGLVLASERTEITTGKKETLLAGRSLSEFPLKQKQKVVSLRPLAPASGTIGAADLSLERRIENVGFNIFTRGKVGLQQQKANVLDLNKKLDIVGAVKLGAYPVVAPFNIARKEIFKAGERVGITPESIGKFLGGVSSKQQQPAKPSKMPGGEIALSIKDRSKFIESSVSTALAFPRDKPLQTAALFAFPGVVKAGTTVGKIIAGKKLLSLAKTGAVSPGFITGATTAGRVLGTTTEVGFGVGVAKFSVEEFRAAPTIEAKGEVFGRKAFEAGAVLTGALAAGGGGRLQEVFEAKVKNPLLVASTKEFSAPVNIQLAEDIGKVGLQLSTRTAEIVTQKRVPRFTLVEGVSKKDEAIFKRFFRQKPSKRFVKGSLQQEAFLSEDLAKGFVQVKGGKISDVDLGSEFGIAPPTKVKTDVKKYSESRVIVGARELTRQRGISGQAFTEQSFRKAVGGFDVKPDEVLAPQFGRLKKDPRDLIFNILEARRAGIRVSRSSQRNIEKALLGEAEGVTLPIKQEKEQIEILRAVFDAERMGIAKPVSSKRLDDSVFRQTPRKRKRSKPSTSKASEDISKSILPSISPSKSPSPSRSVSPSISRSISRSISQSIRPSISPSFSPSISRSISMSVSPSISRSVSPSASASFSPSLSPSLISRRATLAPVLFGKPKGKRKKKKLKGSKLTRETRFLPSLVAVDRMIKGKAPKRLTGLEIRPIIGGR